MACPKLGSVRYFAGSIGDFMPYNRIQIIKTNSPADNADVGVEGEYEVAPEIPSCHADISDRTNQSSPGDKDTKGMAPDLFQFTQEFLIILDMSQLIGILMVPFAVPVRRRGDNEMDRFVLQKG
jgi:hypothetical protein